MVARPCLLASSCRQSQHGAKFADYFVLATLNVGGPRLTRFVGDSTLEGAVRCELVSAAGSDSAPYEFLESIKKEGPQPSDALPPFSCNQN